MESTKRLSNLQKKTMQRLLAGYELRIDVSKNQFSPTLLKEGNDNERTSMKTITALRAKKLIKDSAKYNPPYHYYVLSELGRTIPLT